MIFAFEGNHPFLSIFNVVISNTLRSCVFANVCARACVTVAPIISLCIYEDTQEISFNDVSTKQDEMPTRRPISDTRDRLKTDIIESLFRHMGWETGESMIELHLDRYKIEQENGQTILSFKKGDKWFNLTSKRTGGFRERNSIEKIMTNTHLKNLGISILDMTPTDLEIEDLTPQQLEDVVRKVTTTIGTNTVLDMREFVRIDKALTRITGELKNNVSKLRSKSLEREHKKLDEIGDGDIRDRIKNRIADLKE